MLSVNQSLAQAAIKVTKDKYSSDQGANTLEKSVGKFLFRSFRLVALVVVVVLVWLETTCQL